MDKQFRTILTIALMITFVISLSAALGKEKKEKKRNHSPKTERQIAKAQKRELGTLSTPELLEKMGQKTDFKNQSNLNDEFQKRVADKKEAIQVLTAATGITDQQALLWLWDIEEDQGSRFTQQNEALKKDKIAAQLFAALNSTGKELNGEQEGRLLEEINSALEEEGLSEDQAKALKTLKAALLLKERNKDASVEGTFLEKFDELDLREGFKAVRQIQEGKARDEQYASLESKAKGFKAAAGLVGEAKSTNKEIDETEDLIKRYQVMIDRAGATGKAVGGDGKEYTAQQWTTWRDQYQAKLVGLKNTEADKLKQANHQLSLIHPKEAGPKVPDSLKGKRLFTQLDERLGIAFLVTEDYLNGKNPHEKYLYHGILHEYKPYVPGETRLSPTLKERQNYWGESPKIGFPK